MVNKLFWNPNLAMDILQLSSYYDETYYVIQQTEKGYKLEITYHSTKQIVIEPTRYNKSLTRLFKFAQKHSEEKIYDN